MIVDEFFQAFLKHVCVNLRRRDICVTKQLLHRAQIRATVEQVAREGMAQDVR